MREEFMLKLIECQTIVMLAGIQKIISNGDLTDTERIEKIGRVLTELPDISQLTVIS